MNGHSSHKRMDPNESASRTSASSSRSRTARSRAAAARRSRRGSPSRPSSPPRWPASARRSRRSAASTCRRPLGLRERIERRARPRPRPRSAAAASRSGARSPAPPPRRRWPPSWCCPRGAGGPTVVEAAQLVRAARDRSPTPSGPGATRSCSRQREGVPYPNLDGEFGWREAGQRTDEIEGRETTTVFYERAASGSATRSSRARRSTRPRGPRRRPSTTSTSARSRRRPADRHLAAGRLHLRARRARE